MVLVDSSIWIRAEHGRILISSSLPEDEDAAVCPVVMMEVLRGVRSNQYDRARAMLMAATVLDAPTPLERFEEAAQLYLRCRSIGVTPSAVDCLVAACALAYELPLLHDDRDFENMKRVVPLRTVTRSSIAKRS